MPDADRSLLGRSLSLQTSERTQVSLSRRTGAAKPRMLFSSELGLTDLRFEGEILVCVGLVREARSERLSQRL